MGMRAVPPPGSTVQQLAAVDGFYRGQQAKNVFVLGRRDAGWTSTSALGDCAQYLDTSQASINTPTAGQTLYLVSTSVNDAAAGTGARTVRIVYLDANGEQQVRTDTLNGTTPVSIGTGYTYIQWAETATAGSGGMAAGDVTISSTNGAATVATTFEMIKAGGNRSLSARYKVPTGWTAYLTGWDAHAIGANMDSRLRATVFADDRSLSTVHHFQDIMFVPAGTSDDESTDFLLCPAGTEIKVSAIPGIVAAGNRLDTGIKMTIVKNNP